MNMVVITGQLALLFQLVRVMDRSRGNTTIHGTVINMRETLVDPKPTYQDRILAKVLMQRIRQIFSTRVWPALSFHQVLQAALGILAPPLEQVLVLVQGQALALLVLEAVIWVVMLPWLEVSVLQALEHTKQAVIPPILRPHP